MKENEAIRGIPKEKVMADLEKYRKMALDAGAAEVTIAPPSMVIQSIRALLTCALQNVCCASGGCYYCPPQLTIPSKIAKAINREYEYVLITRTPQPLEALMGPACVGPLIPLVEHFGRDWPPEIVKYWKDWAKEHRITWQFPDYASIIEHQARMDGYHFAFNCTGGGCVNSLCSQWGYNCTFRNSPFCRFPGKPRPDWAAFMGVDFPKLVRQFGRQQAVAGFSTMLAEDIPLKYSEAYTWGIIYIV